MNELPPIDDDLLSAHLDGETTPADAARIDADPAAMARLEELRAARDLAATPVAALDDDTSARLRATAVGASAAPADELARRRARHRPRVAVIGAAAAALVVVVGLASIIASVESGDDDTASVSLDASTEGEDAADLEFHAESADDSASEDGSGDDAGAALSDADESGSDAMGDATDDAALDAATVAGIGGDGLSLYAFRLDGVDDVDDLDELRDRLQEESSSDAGAPAATTTTLAPGGTAARSAEWNAVTCATQLQAALERTPGAFGDGGPFTHAVIAIGGVPTVVAFLEGPDATLTIALAPMATCAPVDVELDFLRVLEE